MKRGFVLGWYGHGNLGDEAFQPCFKSLFPSATLTFGDSIPSDINDYDFLWIGGGSFLDQAVPNPSKIDIRIPIGFIGVGVGAHVSDEYLALLKKAKIIVVRDHLSVAYMPSGINFTVASDLVFSTPPEASYAPTKKVTVLLNDFLTPPKDAADWKQLSFNWFVNQFSKVCDKFIDKGYEVHFYPMCISRSFDDRRTAASVISKIENRDNVVWHLQSDTNTFFSQLATSELVISQRLHGMIYSAKLGVPFIALSCHDKTKGFVKDLGWGGVVDYYGFTEDFFTSTYQYVTYPPTALKDNIRLLGNYQRAAMKRWEKVSDTIAQIFDL